MNFLKRVLATVVGIFVFLGLSFFLLLAIGSLFSGSEDDRVKIEEKTILSLNLDQVLPDYQPKSEEDKVINELLGKESHNDLFDIIAAIDYASTDPNIEGISISNLSLQAGMAQTKALRDALLRFKESGKFITAYGDIISQKDYYLNSVADAIYLNPVGALDFKGLSSEILYFKDFQDKYGLKMEVIRHGKYKSAVEPYLAQEMSEANKEQISVFLHSIWNNMKNEIGASRNISTANLDTIANQLLSRTAKMALDHKLIDHVGYIDEYKTHIKTKLGIESDDDINTVSIYKYAKHAAKKIKVSQAKTKDKIAVIYAQGQIMYGEGDESTIGQTAINKALKKAREDDKIKAIVMRVNSPGGSALASELIWREIERTKNVKPVVVSMGNLAASGGYYIACNADKIIAEPNTITGSIGVFGTLPNAHEFMKSIGINAESVQTHKNAISYSPFEPLSEAQHDIIKEGVVDIYSLFVKRVADGRNKTSEAINEIAQGRVWTGQDALNIGLVDQLGGLDVALEEAAKLAQIETYKVKELPNYEKDFEKMFSRFGIAKTKEELLREELGAKNYEVLQQLKNIAKVEGAQMLLPFQLNIN